MFRVRGIYSNNTPINKKAVFQVQKILKDQFPLLHKSDIDKIPDMLHNPMKYRFKAILFVSDNIKGDVNGFALVLYASDLGFCYLDFIVNGKTINRTRRWRSAVSKNQRRSDNAQVERIIF